VEIVIQSPFGNSDKAIPFTSPEDLMRNLPKTLSNVFSAGVGMLEGFRCLGQEDQK
jgi:hypothetical protein